MVITRLPTLRHFRKITEEVIKMIFSNDPKELEEQLKHVKIQSMEEYLKEAINLEEWDKAKEVHNEDHK